MMGKESSDGTSKRKRGALESLKFSDPALRPADRWSLVAFGDEMETLKRGDCSLRDPPEQH